jgi:hypothetical protein
MTDQPLSPAAASIVQAFDDRYELLGGLEENWQEDCLAAALRAVAPLMECVQDHSKLLAIAAELEATNP